MAWKGSRPSCAVLVATVLAATLVVAPTLAGAVDGPGQPTVGPDLQGGDASGCDSALTDCQGPIRPGARMIDWAANAACTLNFVVTDGEDLYVGTAGHCVSEGDRVHVGGDAIGTVVFSEFTDSSPRIDAAFIEVDEEHEADVDPTMEGWGGPAADATGEAVEDPVPGETIYYYGHGVGISDNSRHGEVTTPAPPDAAPQPPFLEHTFTFAGWVNHGDSGGPVVTTTGQAAGILTLCYLSCSPDEPRLDGGTSFETSMDLFAADLGQDLRIVEGDGWNTVDNAQTAAQETRDRV